MSDYRVRFMPQNVDVTVEEGTDLLTAQIRAGLHPDAPCGGKGTCGKCLVNIVEGTPLGVQKACTTKVTCDMTVNVQTGGKHAILLEGVHRQIRIASAVRSVNVTVQRCELGGNLSDWKRLKMAVAEAASIDEASIVPNMRLISGLYRILQANDYSLNVVLCGNEILDLRAADDPFYVMAFDIGTTTIVGYLLNAVTGEELAVSSMLNPQSEHGADVIERSNYVISNGVEELGALVHEALNELIGQAVKKAGVSREQIYMISVVGNTCMHHLFAGVSPEALVHAPYNPTVSEGLMLKASDLEIGIFPEGKVMLLPNIAGFVGADTVGVLLATEFDELEELSLAIDIGTNGEMVMGNKDRRVACSTAAGPAFEGAKIACGMRGAKGAIDHAGWKDGQFVFSVIGGGKPVGICGSGLMDIITFMLEKGLMDEMGRMLDADEYETEEAESCADRIIRIGENNMKAFLLADENESGNGRPVYLSQKDIREVQLAKSAMAAGITLMADTLGVEIGDIKKVMIAGAFGNYMEPHSACGIGMIPGELEERIVPVGNAAGEGAKIAALNYEEYKRCEKIAAGCEFLELATHPDFQDTFVDLMEFPEQEF
ncbi:MAG: ASKHA domain-containing protein [Lachnospiraceae bacterium]|nr:ASKHA domain-containing protein [Lachnospiraceae bacterium]